MSLPASDIARLLNLAGITHPTDPRYWTGAVGLAWVLGAHIRDVRIDTVQATTKVQKRERAINAGRVHLEKALAILSRDDLRFDLNEAWLQHRVSTIDPATEQQWADSMVASIERGEEAATPWKEEFGAALDTVRALIAAVAEPKPAFRLTYDSTATVGRLMTLWKRLGNGEPTHDTRSGEPRPTPFTRFAAFCLSTFDGVTDCEDAPLFIKDVTTAVANLRRKALKQKFQG